MLKTEKILALMAFSFAFIIVVGMLNGRPPLAPGATLLDFIFNGLLALMLVLLGAIYLSGESQHILKSAAIYDTVANLCVVTGVTAFLISTYRLIEIFRDDFGIFN